MAYLYLQLAKVYIYRAFYMPIYRKFHIFEEIFGL